MENSTRLFLHELFHVSRKHVFRVQNLHNCMLSVAKNNNRKYVFFRDDSLSHSVPGTGLLISVHIRFTHLL